MPPVQETTPSYHLFTASSSSGLKLSNATVDNIETAVFNMMVRRNITEFGGANFSSQVPSSDILLPEFEKHIVISNYEPDFGTTWAIRANHVDGTTPSSINGLQNNFSTAIGQFGSGFTALGHQTYVSNTLNNVVTLDNENTTYYDSHLLISFADGIPAVTTGTDTYREIVNGSVTVRFDDADTHYNAFKAANSFLSSGSKNIQNGLRITDTTSFNSAHSLLTPNSVVRNADNNCLSIGDKYYGDFTGHSLSVVSVNNEDAFFGALKFEQVDATITIDKTDSSLRRADGSALPTTFTSTEFNSLFEGDDTTQRLSDIGDKYSMSIEGVSGGGYATEFRGFTLDNSELTVNTSYMSAISALSGVEHSIDFVNGHITLTSDASSTNNAFFTVSDNDETLDINTYNTSGSVIIHHNGPEARATIVGTDESSGRITALRTTYADTEPSYSASVGVLSSEHKATSNVKFDVECLLKTTSSDSDVSQTSTNDLYIGNKTNHSFYIPNNNTALKGSDITITNVSNAITSDVKLFQIKQSYLMAGESPLYSVVNGTPTSNDASTSVSLTGLNMSTLPSKDMRVVLKPKTASQLSAWTGPNAPFWSHSNATDKCLAVDPNIVSFMSAYELFEIPHTLDMTYTIDQFGITVEQMRRSLTVVSSGNGTYDEIEYTDNSSDMTRTNEPAEPIYKESVIIATFNPVTTTNTIRNSTNKMFKYKGKTKTRINLVAEMTVTRYNLSVILPYGQYSNLSLNTASDKPIYETSIRIFLLEEGTVPKEVIASFRNVELNTDATAPVDKTINFTFTDKAGFSATSITDTEDLETSLFFSEDRIRCRKFLSYELNNIASLYTTANGIEIKHRCNMTAHDLYTSTYYLESQSANGSWVKYNAIAEQEIDICYGTEISNSGIVLSVEMGSDVIGGPNDTYYIDMAVTKGSATYSISGYAYGAADLSEMPSSWSPYSNDSFYLPITVGSEITNLSTEVITNATTLGGQSQITLKVLKDADVLFTLDCATNIIANINIVGNGGPIFKVVETLGDATSISGANASFTNVQNNTITRYIVGGKTYTKVVNGVEIKHASTVDRGDKCSLALLGDSVSASLYTGYNGTFTTKTELTHATGNVITVAGCNSLTTAFYRGITFVENVNDTNRETISIARTPTTATFKLSVNGTTYSQLLGDVYTGRTYVIDTLSTLGGIGLKLTANHSRFTGVTALSQSVTNTFGSYNITTANPLMTSVPVVTTVSAHNFSIQNYTGTYALNIVAGCVKVSDSEKYKIMYNAYGIAVYKCENNYVCDATQIPESEWTLSSIYSDTELRTMTTGVLTGVTFNQIRLARIALNVKDMPTAYANCPRPQLTVDAVSRLNINALAYGANIPLHTYYVDIDFAVVKEPFKINNAVVAGLNNIKLSYNTVESYTGKRLSADNTIRYISIPSNKVTVKLYSNFSTSNIDYATAIPLATVIDDKFISELDNAGLQADAFTGAYNTSTLSATFQYTQPLDIFTSSFPMDNGLKPTLYADERTAVRNIQVNNINAFSVGTGILDMNPGDSISLDVYGLRLSPAKSTINDISVTTGMRVTFIKYSTDYSIDFYNPQVQSLVKELHISPTKRYTKSVVVNVPPFVYSDTTTLMDRMLTGVVLGSTWSEETLSTIKPLETRISALDGRGKELILKMLAVSPQYPMNLLLISQPDLINFKSATGATKFRVNYNGVLIVNRIRNEQLIVVADTETGAESPNLAPELFVDRVTEFSAP